MSCCKTLAFRKRFETFLFLWNYFLTWLHTLHEMKRKSKILVLFFFWFNFSRLFWSSLIWIVLERWRKFEFSPTQSGSKCVSVWREQVFKWHLNAKSRSNELSDRQAWKWSTKFICTCTESVRESGERLSLPTLGINGKKKFWFYVQLESFLLFPSVSVIGSYQWGYNCVGSGGGGGPSVGDWWEWISNLALRGKFC